jgi:hypothetical protein
MTARLSAGAELAVVLAPLKDEFGKLPPVAQDLAAARWRGIDAALADEVAMAVDAIRRWEQRHLALFDEARRDTGEVAVIARRPWQWPPLWPDCPAPRRVGRPRR